MSESRVLQPFTITEADDLHTDLPRRIAEAFEEHGVVLVRDLVPDLAAFQTVTDRLGRFQVHSKDQFGLGKFGQRYGLNDEGTTTTVNLGSEEIPLHRERAYTPMPPQVMFFHCVTQPDAPAPTTAMDGCAFYASLPADLRAFADDTRLGAVPVGA